jgi:hypothetical protein
MDILLNILFIKRNIKNIIEWKLSDFKPAASFNCRKRKKRPRLGDIANQRPTSSRG